MIKVVQFGEGNFLRAFVDAYFETLNREGGSYSVSIVTPIPGNIGNFALQNNQYHAIYRGMQDGQAVETPYDVHVLEQVIDPFVDAETYYKQAKEPELKIIVSNTTEAGICFHDTDKMDDFAGMTYPGKLTLFLYERFKAGLGGLYLMPVELIDNNADNLSKCVKQYIKLWNLPEEFAKWNDEKNFYCNTLVDRIVSGYPRDEQTRAHLTQLLGEEDKLMTVAEPFGLWVVENKGELAKYIKDGRHNIDVVLTDDVTPYKKRKVRVLNGSHTNLVATGLLEGAQTVYDSMMDKKLFAFVKETMAEEIVPFVPGSEAFAEDVLSRFSNPYLNHQLTSIALNSISKWKARNLPSFKDYYAAKGCIPKRMTIGFSYLMALYARVEAKENGWFSGNLPVMDDKPYLEYFANGGSVRDFMAKTDVWGEDLTAYEGFADAVMENVKKICAGVSLL